MKRQAAAWQKKFFLIILLRRAFDILDRDKVGEKISKISDKESVWFCSKSYFQEKIF